MPPTVVTVMWTVPAEPAGAVAVTLVAVLPVMVALVAPRIIGRTDEARIQVETILLYLSNGNLNGTDEPIRVYLTCYHSLKAANDPRAEKTLITAYNFLQERAERIQDHSLRQSFLDNVPSNRELMAEMNNVQ